MNRKAYLRGVQPHNKPQDWLAAMRLARHNGRRWLADLDLLGYSLALEGQSVLKLPDDDARLEAIRREAGIIIGSDNQKGSKQPKSKRLAERDDKLWKMVQQGYSTAHIGDELGLGDGVVRSIISKQRGHYNDHADYGLKRVAELRGQGMSLDRIAAALGYTSHRVGIMEAHLENLEKVSS